MIKKSILSMVVIGLLGVSVAHATSFTSEETKAIEVTYVTGQKYQYEDTKEEIALIESKKELIIEKIKKMGSIIATKAGNWGQGNGPAPIKEEMFGPNLVAFLDKHIDTDPSLKKLCIAIEERKKVNKLHDFLTDKFKSFHDIWYRTKDDYSSHIIQGDNLIPELYQMQESVMFGMVYGDLYNKAEGIIGEAFNRNKALYNNKKLVFNVFTKFPTYIDNLPKEVLNDEKFMIEIIKKFTIKPHNINKKDNYISSIYRAELLPIEIRNNKKVVYTLLETLKEYPNNSVLIEFVGNELYKDSDFAEKLSEMKLSKWNIVMIDKFTSKIRSDDDIGLNFVKNSGADALKYLSSELKDNKKFMLKCLKLDAKSYQYASDKLKEDDDIRAFKPYR